MRFVCDCGCGAFATQPIRDSLMMLMPFVALRCLRCGFEYATELPEPMTVVPMTKFLDTFRVRAHERVTVRR